VSYSSVKHLLSPEERRHVKKRDACAVCGCYVCECAVRALDGMMRDIGLPAPVAEHPFHPERKWRFDRAWPDYGVAVEVDGGLSSGGRHVRKAGYEEDCRKINEAMIRGWLVIRVSTGMVHTAEALSPITAALISRGWRKEDTDATRTDIAVGVEYPRGTPGSALLG